MKTIIKLLKLLRKHYPNLSNVDIVIAGLEELLNQNQMIVGGYFAQHRRKNYKAGYDPLTNDWKNF